MGKNVKAFEDLVKNETQLVPSLMDNDLSVLKTLTSYFLAVFRKRCLASIWSGIKLGRGGCIETRSMDSKLSGGGGCEVLGGKSSKLSTKGCGEVGGVWKTSSKGCMFVARGGNSLGG
ncbi:hypothetical protein Tco_1061973 [Tanacetum coccineum]